MTTTPSKILISNNFPVNKKGHTKNQFTKAFYASHNRALKTIESVEKALRQGNTTKKDKDDW